MHPELCVLGAFSVFCALYLGITRDDGYARQSLSGVAREFGMNAEELETFLADHQLTQEDLFERKFDFDAARYDIQVAPEGISRLELARSIYEELLQTDVA